MANKIILKKSSVANKVPLASDLEVGELAVNLTDKRLYSKDSSDNVVQLVSGDLTNVTSITTPNYITFDTAPSTVPTAEGSLYWDSADGNQTLSLIMSGGDVTQQIGEEQYYRVNASSDITNGQVVMFTGTVGNSGALTAAPATGLTASTASYIMGIATQDIATNSWGYITSFGLVRNINTSAYSDGQILYYDPSVAGGLTATIPTAPNAKVQVCAVVHAHNNGSLFVRPSFGGALGQYEGDVQITSPVSGQVLTYTGTEWTNQTPSAPVSPIVLNSTTINSNYSIASGQNGFSVGPVAVESGYSVTVASGQRWVVI